MPSMTIAMWLTDDTDETLPVLCARRQARIMIPMMA
jgi:hypothetical protein